MDVNDRRVFANPWVQFLYFIPRIFVDEFVTFGNLGHHLCFCTMVGTPYIDYVTVDMIDYIISM